MGDIFDYILFFIFSAFLGVLKVTGFISVDWWIVAAPSVFALCVHLITILSPRS